MASYNNIKRRKGGGGRGNYPKAPPSSRGNYPKAPPAASSSSSASSAGWSRGASFDISRQQQRRERTVREDALDTKFGYGRFNDGPDKTGWLFNVRQTVVVDEETKAEHAAIDGYFVEPDGGTFKGTVMYKPYFLAQLRAGADITVEALKIYVARRFDGVIEAVTRVEKEDLDLPNHLTGLRSTFVKFEFRTVDDLLAVRKVMLPIIEKNRAADGDSVNAAVVATTTTMATSASRLGNHPQSAQQGLHPSQRDRQRQPKDDMLEYLVDIREYDVPYTTRVQVDLGIRCGQWYRVQAQGRALGVRLTALPDKTDRPLLRVLAYDIETTKLPLKFPDSKIDAVMMISYMLDGQGFLIVNREIVAADIDDFEYTPKPEYEGPFIVFNEPDEMATLRRFFAHIQEVRPQVIVTYNGDFFDMPFVRDRALHQYGLDTADEIGLWENKAGEFLGRFCVHLDCFYWVKRDSYLPQGSQGLKAVTKAKLKYDPLELDPEDMLPFAQSKPHVLASYSVSDAVATYYLYMKYVHQFIFSLATIIPLSPADVLRKGSGTLCELLLMVMAFENNIVCPNKQVDQDVKFYEGHLLESETYIGGHVESLESGVFREEFPYKFQLDPAVLQQLIDKVDDTLHFAIGKEAGVDLDAYEVSNYDEVRDRIVAQLSALRDTPRFDAKPLIYHLDVGAMYPNIILTNRLQPMAIVDEATCAACDFNRPSNNCKREMAWKWRGKFFPASKAEYRQVKAQLQYETIKEDAELLEAKLRYTPETFDDLPKAMQHARIKRRVKDYSQKVYKRVHNEVVEERTAVVCQRENPFYVDTVRAFRDRRYEYKKLTKAWHKKLDEAKTAVETQKAKDMVLLYDSLQLAHKCILNSFYGYVMRRGARWRSIEMAGVVTATGADIIKDARVLVEGIGRPLELDTDGIWCMLPCTFPEDFKFKTTDPKHAEVTVSYPCSMLNVQVYEKNTNHQYQTRREGSKYHFDTTSENSIYFEVDGPYRCMALPAAKEEGKGIKKRYAVFNKDGSLAELKGFEIKRRGELKLIKIFQAQVFAQFLAGSTLQECYDAVGACANHWLDVLNSKGATMEDDDLFDLISESKNMTRTLSDYGGAKSTAITTATRLGEFLGADMVKDKGLNCRFIIAAKPVDQAISQRAVPVAIFSAEESVKRLYVRRWLRDSSITNFDIRELLDWDYYKTRLHSAIQKIITIPAAFQKVKNPCPSVPHPKWLHNMLRNRDDPLQQQRISRFFKKKSDMEEEEDDDDHEDGEEGEDEEKTQTVDDMEDMFGGSAAQRSKTKNKKLVRRVIRHRRDADGMEIEEVVEEEEEEEEEDGGVMVVEEKEEDIITQEPPDQSNFGEWIAFQKKRWAALRKKRRRDREAELEAQRHVTAPVFDARKGLRGFITQSNRVFRRKYWQIVQVAPDTTPGFFRVWAFSDHNLLHAVRVKVPRVIYVNSRVPHGVVGIGKPVQRRLPRGRPCLHLYEIEMDEAQFVKKSKYLNNFLNNPNIEGVYEAHVPLEFRFIVKAGCVARLNASKLDARSNEYTLDALEGVASAEYPYLPPDTDLSRLYLYHSTASSANGAGLVALFDEHSSEAHVWVVNPFGGDADRINLDRAYAAKLESIRDDLKSAAQQPPEAFTFHVDQKTSAKRVWRAVQAQLRHASTTTNRAQVLLVQADMSLEELYAHVPVVREQYPVVRMPFDSLDAEYPSFHWYRFCVDRALTGFLYSRGWWDEQLEYCRYAHIPIGNLQRDVQVQTCDVFFARDLQSNRHLLWSSPSIRPDLGGFEEDENFFEEEHANPEIISPGFYKECVMQLSVEFLPYAAVDSYALLEDGIGEGVTVERDGDDDDDGGIDVENQGGGGDNAGGGMGGTTNGSGGSGGGVSDDAFKILRSMLKRMYVDVVESQNRFADGLLYHFYRWLRSTGSLMYDGKLHRYVHKLMKKLFVTMVARFKSYRVPVVYASFNLVILATRKNDAERAKEYVGYVLNTLQKRDLFAQLNFSQLNLWDALVFLDSANHASIRNGQLHNTQWDIARYLPKLADEYFHLTIANFMLKAYEHFAVSSSLVQVDDDDDDDDDDDEYGGPSARGGGGGGAGGVVLGGSQDLSQNVELQASLKQFMCRLVERDLTRELLERVQDVHEKLVSDERALTQGSVFPVRPGSHLRLTNPALEFVKYVCHVLSLDPDLEGAVRVLRSNLLRLIKVRAFSDQAQFANPCRTYVLPDVICNRCHTSRDLDLCRDPNLVDGDWRCSTEGCGHPYDREEIEDALVQVLTKRCVSYQVQDVRCSRCRRVKGDNLREYCECSGVFRNALGDRGDLEAEVRVFNRIAEFYDMPVLLDACSWHLQLQLQQQ